MVYVGPVEHESIFFLMNVVPIKLANKPISLNNAC